MKLLQEISDRKEAGKLVIVEKKEDKKKADREAKKRLSIRKAGEDICVKAMQTLAEGGQGKCDVSLSFWKSSLNSILYI